VVAPLGSRDRLAELLSDGEIETSRHLTRERLGANTIRAMASDLAHLEAWSLAAGGGPLPWLASEGLVLRFVAHHLYDPALRFAARAARRPRGRKSAKAPTRDVFERLITSGSKGTLGQPRRRPAAPRLRLRRPPPLGDRGSKDRESR
jgi:hypothetical protein